VSGRRCSGQEKNNGKKRNALTTKITGGENSHRENKEGVHVYLQEDRTTKATVRIGLVTQCNIKKNKKERVEKKAHPHHTGIVGHVRTGKNSKRGKVAHNTRRKEKKGGLVEKGPGLQLFTQV